MKRPLHTLFALALLCSHSLASSAAQSTPTNRAHAGLDYGALPRAAKQAEGEAQEQRNRSVLFYLMDTSRGDRMAFNGYGRKTTPFLAWLAERSVVFESCYSQAPWTKPSMAALLTSQYPSTLGVIQVQHKLADEHLTWPEVLREGGLHTAGFSANIIMGNTVSNFAQGFDHFTESTLINRADPIRFASGSAKKLNQHAFAWLERNERWPLLLYMHSVDPHEEYEPEPQYLRQFADPERHPRFRNEWQRLLKSRPPIPGLYVTQDNFDRTGVDTQSFIQHASDLYDADILANDAELKRLWDKLQVEGWGEDMILVFTSDHGDEFFEHGGTSHGYSLYDEMLRVPLMIYAPGLLPAGRRIKAPVRSLDIYPTLCELLDLPVPAGLEGRSLLPLIQGGEQHEDMEIFSEHREAPELRAIKHGSGQMVSLRSGRWKLILNHLDSQLIQRPYLELYDMLEDPGEQRNLAQEEPEVASRLAARVKHFISTQWADPASAISADLEPEALDELRALGYVGDDEEEDDAELLDIWEAMDSDDPQAVERLLAAGARVDQLHGLFGLQPLSMAALRGDLPLAKVLVAAGAKVNELNQDGSSPLSGAAFLGRIEVLEFLLDQGADPLLVSNAGDTALSAANSPWDATEFIANMLQIPHARADVFEGRKQCIELLELVLSELDPSARLHRAIQRGRLAEVEAALEQGAQLDALDQAGARSALYLASSGGNLAIVQLLLERGAKPDGRNRDRSTALHGAALMGHTEVTGLLLQQGATPDAQDAKGATPLHLAAFFGREQVSAELLRRGAQRDPRDAGGMRPVDYARSDWATTRYVLQEAGLVLPRAELERGRKAILEQLEE